MTDHPAPEGFEAQFAALRTKREAAGTNVHYINENGHRSMMSMRDAASADRLRAKLRRDGLEVL